MIDPKRIATLLMSPRRRFAAALLGGLPLLLGACAAETDDPPCEGDGVICTYMGNGKAGLGKDGEAPLEVSLYLPQDLTFGPDDQPYVADWNNHRIRTIKDGKVETVIGTGYLGDAVDGPAKEASLNHPTHISFDPDGRMIMSAWHNSKVMRYDADSGLLETLCGTGMRDYAGDEGPAPKAVLDLPVATAFDSQGRMLVMDQANQRIRRIDENDMITTIVGPNKAFMPAPDYLERVCGPNPMTGVEQCKLCKTADAADPMCAAQKPQGFAGDDGPGTEALMFQPFSQSAPPAGRMEMGPDDTLYFCDTGNHRVRALDADGTVHTVAGSGPETFDRNFKGGYAGDGGPALEAKLKSPTDVAVGKGGVLYIADTKNSCVRKVDKKGVISTLAGKCGHGGFEGDSGPPEEALLNQPYGLTLHAGNLYIADTYNHRIRVVYGVE
jgi:sugar lactone lactonase YvrE